MEKIAEVNLKRIAIVGPESTGKTILSSQLAAQYDTLWVPEYARTFLENLDRKYSEQDLLFIAKEQVALEDKVAKKGKGLLFCDTNVLVIKIWSMHAYGKCHRWILTELDKRKYDLVLLTNIDLPWVEDPLREHPYLRSYFMDWYRKELNLSGVKYREIQGIDLDSRLEAAKLILKEHELV